MKKGDIIAQLREFAKKMNLDFPAMLTEEQLLQFVKQSKKQIGEMRETE